MPTGYTADVQDGKITELEDFVWRCARNMGALIMMRELPTGAPIPERFEPSVGYHDEAIAKAESSLASLRGMSLPALREAAQQDYADQVKSDDAWQSGRKTARDRYEAMLQKVEDWTPPTSEHEGLKEFMFSQLTQSIEFDCPTTRYSPAPTKMEPEAWRDKQIEEAARSLAYHTKARREEVERTEARNRWVAELRRSFAGAPMAQPLDLSTAVEG